MRRLFLLILVVGGSVGSVAFAGENGSRQVITHSGRFVGIGGSSHIDFKAVLEDGKLRVVKNLRLRLPVYCGGERDGFVWAHHPRAQAHGRHFRRRTHPDNDVFDDGFERVSGRLSRNGRRAHGFVVFRFHEPDSGEFCTTHEQRWNSD